MQNDIIKTAQEANECFKKGDYINALSKYYSILSMDLNNSITHCNIATVYEILNEFELAVAFYKRAIRLDEKNIRAINNLAGLYINTIKEYDIAQEYLDFAIKTAPNDPEAYNLYGNLYLIKKDYKLSETYFKKAIFLDSKFFKNYYDLARCYMAQNDNKKALDNINKCIELESEFEPAIKIKEALS